MSKPAKQARRKEQPTPAIPNPTPSVQADDARGPGCHFPIVGIGASAGGLEAMELFLRNVPEAFRSKPARSHTLQIFATDLGRDAIENQ